MPDLDPFAEITQRLAGIPARLGAALDEVRGLVDGTRRWTVRIPADETRDSDLVLRAALDDAEWLLGQLEKRTHERDAARAEMRKASDQVAAGQQALALLYEIRQGRWEPVHVDHAQRTVRAAIRVMRDAFAETPHAGGEA